MTYLPPSTAARSVAVRTVTANTALTATDDTVLVNAAISTTVIITLPTAVGTPVVYTLKNIGLGTVTLASTGGQTVDGAVASALSLAAGTARRFVSDGVNWWSL